jgi:putative tryptophan/tyrosine transport system substrate-binding protein
VKRCTRTELSRRHFLRSFLGVGLSAVGASLSIGCTVFAPRVPASANRTNVPRIGLLVPESAGASDAVEPLREGLSALGLVDGQHIAIEERFAEGRSERLSPLAAELVRSAVDVIVAVGTAAARAAKQSTSTIPIVFSGAVDPIGSGLVSSLERPSGNASGTTQHYPQLASKRLELLKQAVPTVSRVAVLRNPPSAAAAASFEETRGAARSLGMQVQAFELRDPNTFHAIFQAVGDGDAEAIVVLNDPLLESYRTQIVDLAAKTGLPAMYESREFAEAGGLMAYGASHVALHRAAASYVDRILKGARPADLPVEQPTQFELVINLRGAQALGLTLPEPILAQSTEVLQ